ncbi:acyl-CoA carboxylase subunit epsilon [Kibdelosporangium aridum]|uniref:Acyl-CoA carboxylase subunit epsilon n=1 Tax=Kibdelosporangium aridum TaxID=2030 RepID=A0A428Z0E6_KIBAR|nr:acyl-CoA carboxylase subunit epsilon [Kibdelosporangium aridum]RSM77694.1 acyl-CoA carboxylase subunit epsilon [Kibdelosporangium aridum]
MTPADVVVVKGRPDDEELAALIAVLTAIKAKAAQQSAEADRESLWATGPGRPTYRPPGAWTPLRARRVA